MSSDGRMRVAGYVRATTPEEKQTGVAPAEQRARIEQYASERGWEIDAIYEDVGAAAGTRDALARLLEDLDGIDKVVVARLDRFARLARRVNEVVERLQAAGVDVVAIEDEIDSGTEQGALFPRLLGLLAEWERANDWLGEGWRPENVRKRGFAPETVIDVGAGRGTPILYRAFPDAYHVMLEPLAEFEDELGRLLKRRRGEYLRTAVGAEQGVAMLRVDPECLLASSMNEVTWRDQNPENPLVEREVAVTTLDRLLEERQWKPPFGLKIDTEGFEDRVIKGATSLLRSTQFVLAEVSVTKRFEGSYTFAEFITLMDSHDFELCDILNVVKYVDQEASFMDALFRRRTDGQRTGSE
jgi:FkbM family methyltransferase